VTLTPIERYIRSISEDDWQATVIPIAGYQGWDYWHDTDSRRSKAGLPDLLLWKPGQFMAVELKKELGVVSSAQLMMLSAWDRAGVECHIWRPSHEAYVKIRLHARGRTNCPCDICTL
jgi:hypothetical protein